MAESIERFIEGLAFLPSYDLAPPPPPFPVSKLSLLYSLPVCRPSSLLTKERGRGGGGAKSYDSEKAWSSIIHSVLSVSLASPQ
jgi:hypothetical protein